jgi:hypothetical protein
MVTTVVVINTLISLGLLYIAWRVWKLKLWLGRVADQLTVYERNTHAVLHHAPENIEMAQKKIHSLGEKNQRLQLQIAQIRQIISLLLLGKRFWANSLGRIGLISINKNKPVAKSSNIFY